MSDNPRAKETLLAVCSGILFTLSAFVIVYFLCLLLIYVHGVSLTRVLHQQHDDDLKYFRFAWLSEHVCNKSAHANFVTIDCNLTSKLNSTARFDPFFSALNETYHTAVNSNYVPTQFIAEASYMAHVRYLANFYESMEGPWVFLLLYPFFAIMVWSVPVFIYRKKKKAGRERVAAMNSSNRSFDEILRGQEKNMFFNNNESEAFSVHATQGTLFGKHTGFMLNNAV